jgi:hypothetical protein
MQTSGTHTGSRAIGAGTRLRLVELRTPAGDLPLGGGFACVRTPPAACHAVAAAISRSVIGPRDPDVGGTLDIAGAPVDLATLPAPLLPPHAPATVDTALLDSYWQAICARARVECEAQHAAARLERHRAAAAAERASGGSGASGASGAPAARPPATAGDAVARHAKGLLARLDGLEPVPDPHALELAAAFDELALHAPTHPVATLPDGRLELLERRVAAARASLTFAAGGVSGQARAQIEECHRAVVDADRELFEAGRKERAAALEHYQRALALERAALDDAGIDSYAAFLVAIAAGTSPVEKEAWMRAELELAEAQAELDQARRVTADAAEARELGEWDLELRARAAQVLGHFPSDDPAAELRAHRIPHPDVAGLQDELARLLASEGVDPGGDLLAAARELANRVDTEPPVDVAVHAHDPLDDELAALEAELARLDAQSERAFVELPLEQASLVFEYVLDVYRSGDLLAGRLPLVVDGALDRCAPAVAETIAARCAEADDVQVIVVSGDDAVASALERRGAVTVRFPAKRRAAAGGATGGGAAGTTPRAHTVPPATSPRPCAVHPDQIARADCEQCGRGACLDCLVYVPAAPELRCVECASTYRRHNVRLTRPRGA